MFALLILLAAKASATPLFCAEGTASEGHLEEDGVIWAEDVAYFGPRWLAFPAESRAECRGGARRALEASSEQAWPGSRNRSEVAVLNYAQHEQLCVVKLASHPPPQLRPCVGAWAATLFSATSAADDTEMAVAKPGPDGKLAEADTGYAFPEQQVASTVVGHEMNKSFLALETSLPEQGGQLQVSWKALRLGTWRGSLLEGTEGQASWTVLPQLLLPEEVRLIRSRMPPLETFETKPDSIDGNATHELYIYKAAKLLHPALDEVMKPAVKRAMRFARRRFECKAWPRTLIQTFAKNTFTSYL